MKENKFSVDAGTQFVMFRYGGANTLMQPTLCLSSSASGFGGCFYFFAVVSDDAMSMVAQRSLPNPAFNEGGALSYQYRHRVTGPHSNSNLKFYLFNYEIPWCIT